MSNNRSSSYEEFVLYNTSRLKNRGHETEICTSIDKSTISEELFWSSPEASWVLVA